MNIKFGMRLHCGSLEDSLETSVMISETEFNKVLHHYKFYAYDCRCKQLLFIAKNMESTHYTWLFIELKGDL